MLALISLIALVYAKPLPYLGLKSYSVSGTLSLPFSKIIEKFDVWYDEGQNSSRLDFYHGQIDFILKKFI